MKYVVIVMTVIIQICFSRTIFDDAQPVFVTRKHYTSGGSDWDGTQQTWNSYFKDDVKISNDTIFYTTRPLSHIITTSYEYWSHPFKNDYFYLVRMSDGEIVMPLDQFVESQFPFSDNGEVIEDGDTLRIYKYGGCIIKISQQFGLCEITNNLLGEEVFAQLGAVIFPDTTIITPNVYASEIESPISDNTALNKGVEHTISFPAPFCDAVLSSLDTVFIPGILVSENSLFSSAEEIYPYFNDYVDTCSIEGNFFLRPFLRDTILNDTIWAPTVTVYLNDASLSLKYPVNSEIVNNANVKFRWDHSGVSLDSLFIIRTDSISDTIWLTLEKECEISHWLVPGEFKWGIYHSANSEESLLVDSFSIEAADPGDIVTEFQNHPDFSWDNGSTVSDGREVVSTSSEGLSYRYDINFMHARDHLHQGLGNDFVYRSSFDDNSISSTPGDDSYLSNLRALYSNMKRVPGGSDEALLFLEKYITFIMQRNVSPLTPTAVTLGLSNGQNKKMVIKGNELTVTGIDSQAEIFIYSLNGRLLIKRDLASSVQSHIINIGGISKGAYILKLKSQNLVKTHKFIK